MPLADYLAQNYLSADTKPAKKRKRKEAKSDGLVIADDGVGFDPRATAGRQDGYGLFTMRDRAALLGGTVDIDSVIGGGTRVTVTVPERPVARTTAGSDR